MAFTTTASASNSDYSLAFPPLQPFPWTFHTQANKKTQLQSSSTNTFPPSTPISPNSNNPNINYFSHLSFTPPKYPYYLKHTAYATLVTEQYHHLHNKRNSRFNNSLEYNRELEEIDLRLPQCWNKKDKLRHLDVGLNGFDLHYNTANKEPASIRTNFPIRPQCGIYYYEIRVVSKGTDGLFAIGFCTAKAKLNTLPGYDTSSFGYHGQDGTISQQCSSSQPYGPSYISGDIIGCGVNFANGIAFFTKNGVALGTAFKGISNDLLYYPCVGLSSQGERTTANFGQEPFVFDIVQYIKNQQSIPMKEFQNQPDTKAEIDELIVAYLMHQGYLGTADALKKNINYIAVRPVKTISSCNPTDDDEIRGNIRKLVMSGQIDEAIDQTSAHYPGLLENDPDLTFNLKARKFLEILINQQKPLPSQSLSFSFCLSDTEDDDTLSTYSGRSRTLSMGSINEEHLCGNHVSVPLSSSPLSVTASGRRLSWAAVAASPTITQQNNDSSNNIGGECYHFGGDDSPHQLTRRRYLSFNHGRRHSFNSVSTFDEDDIITKAMFYGQQLQEEYRHNVKHLGTLMELFGLLAYADPQLSPMAHLLDTCQRDIIASELNDAIQVYQSHTGTSNLESIYKQSIVTSKELALTGHGKASLLFSQDYLH